MIEQIMLLDSNNFAEKTQGYNVCEMWLVPDPEELETWLAGRATGSR